MRPRIILSFLIFLFVFTSSALADDLADTRAAFKKGYEFLQSGEDYLAIEHFKAVIQNASYPLQDYAYYFIAQAYQNHHHVKEALNVYQMVLNYFPESVLLPYAYYEIAKIHRELQNHEAGIKLLKDSIVQYPQHELTPALRYELGENLEKQGNHLEALSVYQNLTRLHPESDFTEMAIKKLGREASPTSLYNLGTKYFAQKNYPKAKKIFTQAIKAYQNSSVFDEALLMLGRIELRKGRFSSARKWLQKSLKQNKNSQPEAMYYLALTHGYQGKIPTAIHLLEKIAQQFPQHYLADDALFQMGNYYTQQGSSLASLPIYEKLMKAYPQSNLRVEALWNIGWLYYQQENYLMAYQNFVKVLESPFQPGLDRLLFWAAKSAEKSGFSSPAQDLYKKTIYHFDHSYYAYRAREELAKEGSENILQSFSEIQEELTEIAVNSHDQKYQELLSLELDQEAGWEANYVVEKLPSEKKEEAKLHLYHAYLRKGKYRKPIQFADQQIEKAVLAGKKIDPRLWRFSYPRGYWPYVEKFASQYGLDPYLIYAVIREESRFSPKAVSRSRAQGLMQIIPRTARRLSQLLGIRYNRSKVYQPRVNIWMGTYYLSHLIKAFDGNIMLALAGYNGGPNRVAKWLKKQGENFDLDEFVENIPLKETRNYVKKVIKSYYGYKRTYERG